MSDWEMPTYEAYINVYKKLDAALAELQALHEENKALRQIASGNDERLELLAKKYSDQPYDKPRLAALQELVVMVLPREAPEVSKILRKERDELKESYENAVKLAADLAGERDSLRAEADAHRTESQRLREGVEKFLRGDYLNPRSNRPHDCKHGRVHWPDCGQCDSEYFENLLRGEP